MRKSIPVFILILFISILSGMEYKNTWQSLDTRPVPEWFENAKFGIFIHWGVYSVPAWRKLESGLYASYAEWYYARVMYNTGNGGKEFHDKNFGSDFEYRDFAPFFKAELFDPVMWSDLFKRSGAKYVVLTSKHHDGYCLWPTKSPYKKKWNSKTNGPKRDLVGELTKAVRSAGLKMGLYYSIPEWESTKTKKTKTGYFLPEKIINKYKIPEDEYVDKHLIPQLKELVVEYKPSLIFADGGEWYGTENYWRTKEFLSWLYNESPVNNEVVVNDRFAKHMPGNHGDYFSSEYKDADADKFTKPWEESRGIGGSYGFNRAENAGDYSTTKELIVELIDIVSRGGNLLLNVGPTSDGRIPVIMQERLQDIGKWLKINGDAIYESRKREGVKRDERENAFFTTKDKTLFCIFTKWNKNIKIELSDKEKVENIILLGSNKKIEWEVLNSTTLKIEIPKLTIAEIPCMHAWTFKIALK